MVMQVLMTKILCFSPGLVAVLWLILWFLAVHDTPEGHPRITQAEIEYIQKYNGKKVDTSVSNPYDCAV